MIDQTFTARVATPTTRLIGALSILSMAWVMLGGLVFTPGDVNQGDAVRIMYVHVPTAWVAYLAFIVTAVASACWLLSRNHAMGFDRVAGASAEVGVAFMVLTLMSGSLWGRITWGTFWAWDPRLTTTAFLLVTYLGYLAVRGLGGSHQQRARRSAVIALLAVLEIPLVHFSVVMWRSLHQKASVLSGDGDIKMDGSMLTTLLVGVVGFTCTFTWLVMHRARVLAMQDAMQMTQLDAALRERINEGSRSV
ncbi:MAG: cytochrome C biogenesis protein [Actinobacteria bacterium]|nr:MAG: cytochrome C biogenesis protein [Actinomycetota bacterium]